MSPFTHGAYALRCRVCEDVTDPEPHETCRRCDGATDITYDWEVVRELVTAAASTPGRARSGATKRCSDTCPAGVRAGWTPLERVDSLSELLGVDLLLKLEGENPTRSYKDRIASVAVAAAREHGFSTVCCSSTGNLGDAVAAAAAATGLEAMVLAPAERGRRHGRRAAPRRTGLPDRRHRTTTAAGSSSSSARCSRGASSAATSTRTRVKARRRSPSRSPSSSAGDCPTPSSARPQAARCSRSSPRASPS